MILTLTCYNDIWRDLVKLSDKIRNSSLQIKRGILNNLMHIIMMIHSLPQNKIESYVGYSVCIVHHFRNLPV